MNSANALLTGVIRSYCAKASAGFDSPRADQRRTRRSRLHTHRGARRHRACRHPLGGRRRWDHQPHLEGVSIAAGTIATASNWSLTIIPRTAGGAPTFTCSSPAPGSSSGAAATVASTAALSAPGTPACPGSFVNWIGEYYSSNDLSGSATLCRDDRDINFDWGYGSRRACCRLTTLQHVKPAPSTSAPGTTPSRSVPMTGRGSTSTERWSSTTGTITPMERKRPLPPCRVVRTPLSSSSTNVGGSHKQRSHGHGRVSSFGCPSVSSSKVSDRGGRRRPDHRHRRTVSKSGVGATQRVQPVQPAPAPGVALFRYVTPPAST